MPVITVNLSPTISGIISAVPRGTFVKFGSNIIITQTPVTATITSGNGTITLEQSSHVSVSYLFRIYQSTNVDDFFLQGGTLYASTDPDLNLSTPPRWQWTTGGTPDNNWYTGSQVGTSAPTVSNLRLTKVTRAKLTDLIQPFDSVVGASDTNLSALVSIGLTDLQLEYSASRVADLLVNPPYLALLPKGISYKGAYVSTTVYSKDQAVQYNGNLYIWINASAVSGKVPGIDTTFWDLGVSKGASGGTGANAIGYNRTQWLSSPYNLEASARQDVVAAVDSVATPNLTNYARKDLANDFAAVNRFQNPGGSEPLEPVTLGYGDGRYARLTTAQTIAGVKTFSSSPIVPTLGGSDNTTNAANGASIQAALSLFVPNRLANVIADVQRTTAQTLTVSTSSSANGDVIVWNAYSPAGFFNTVGDFNAPAGTPTDTYFLFQGVLTVNASCNFSSGGDRRLSLRIHGTVGAVDIGNANVIVIPTFNGTAQFTLPFSRVYKLSASQAFQLRLHVFDSFGSTVTAASLTASGANNFVNVWRCSA